jgi:hypothetical protein
MRDINDGTPSCAEGTCELLHVRYGALYEWYVDACVGVLGRTEGNAALWVDEIVLHVDYDQCRFIVARLTH